MIDTFIDTMGYLLTSILLYYAAKKVFAIFVVAPPIRLSNPWLWIIATLLVSSGVFFVLGVTEGLSIIRTTPTG